MASEVYGLLYRAKKRLQNECYLTAQDLISDAMNRINEYLTEHNMELDKDAAFGPLIN